MIRRGFSLCRSVPIGRHHFRLRRLRSTPEFDDGVDQLRSPFDILMADESGDFHVPLREYIDLYAPAHDRNGHENAV